jgi:2-polyprenyl-3-methyl-5-hydroxy-6-metoxy-1,4-benzoquinol methylase
MKVSFYLALVFLERVVTGNIDRVNSDFYNQSCNSFNTIPFRPILPQLLQKYHIGHQILEIGSGPGVLALWLKDLGCQVTCLEPAKKLAEMAAANFLDVHPLTIQELETNHQYDCILAISSLIHVPKKDLPDQVQKIAKLLKTDGMFFVSFVEGDGLVAQIPEFLTTPFRSFGEVG